MYILVESKKLVLIILKLILIEKILILKLKNNKVINLVFI